MAVDARRTLALYSWATKRRYDALTSTGMATAKKAPNAPDSIPNCLMYSHLTAERWRYSYAVE